MTGHRRGGPEIARHLMVTGVATALAEAEARAAFHDLAGGRFDPLVNLHVVDAERRLPGLMPLAALAAAPPGVRLAELLLPVRPLHAEDHRCDVSGMAGILHQEENGGGEPMDHQNRMIQVAKPISVRVA